MAGFALNQDAVIQAYFETPSLGSGGTRTEGFLALEKNSAF
jgi:hypothetical protein